MTRFVTSDVQELSQNLPGHSDKFDSDWTASLSEIGRQLVESHTKHDSWLEMTQEQASDSEKQGLESVQAQTLQGQLKDNVTEQTLQSMKAGIVKAQLDSHVDPVIQSEIKSGLAAIVQPNVRNSISPSLSPGSTVHLDDLIRVVSANDMHWDMKVTS